MIGPRFVRVREFRFARLTLVIALICFCATISTDAAEPKIDYGTQIKPILAAQCFKCHGADEKARKGSLRLDTREGAIKTGASGVYGIVPGKPQSSEVMVRITASDGTLMPPGGRKNKLSAEQVELIKQWIQQGAEYNIQQDQ